MTKASSRSLSGPPRHDLAVLRSAILTQHQPLPWEIRPRWRDLVTGYSLLRQHGVPDRLIKAIFYGPQSAKFEWHWVASTRNRAKRARNDKTFPLTNHEDWLALYCVLAGADRQETALAKPNWRKMTETRALLAAWRRLHDMQTGWAAGQEGFADMQPITAALTASQQARDDHNAKVQQKWADTSKVRIMGWLLENGPGRSKDIAEALGLQDAAVRQQLGRIAKDREWLDRYEVELVKLSRGLYGLAPQIKRN